MEKKNSWKKVQKFSLMIIALQSTSSGSLLLDAPTIEILAKIVDVRMHYYNDVRRHSGLDNQSPRKALERWLRDVDEDHK